MSATKITASFVINNGTTIRVWDVYQKKMRVDVPGHVNLVRQLQFRSPSALASKDDQGHWCLWDLKTGRQIQRKFIGDRPRTTWGPIAGSLQKQIYLERTKKSTYKLRSAQDRTQIRPFSLDADDLVSALCELSADGTTLLTMNRQDKQIWARFFDLPSGKKRGEFVGPASRHNFDRMRFPRLSADGRLYAFKAPDNRIGVANTHTGKLLRMYGAASAPKTDWHPLQFVSTFSPDNRLLANVIFPRDAEATPFTIHAQIWDVKTGQEIQRMPIVRKNRYGHDEIPNLAFSPDNRFLAYSEFGEDSVSLSDVASGALRGKLQVSLKIPTALAFSAHGCRLAVGHFDTTIYLWDLRRPLPGHRLQNLTTTKNLKTAWQNLGQRDAAKADAVIWSMIRSPDTTLPFLEKHLHPKQPPSLQQRKKWLSDLDSNRFAVRVKAMQNLAKLHAAAIPFLHDALKRNPPLEVHQRLQILLRKAQQPNRDSQLLRELRALEILERIGTPAARQLLQELAKGHPHYRLTQEAGICLQRLR